MVTERMIRVAVYNLNILHVHKVSAGGQNEKPSATIILSEGMQPTSNGIFCILSVPKQCNGSQMSAA